MNCSNEKSDSHKNRTATALTRVSVKRSYVTSVCLWFTFVSSIIWAVGSGAGCEMQGGALRGNADKSLARPTSRCRRTETIVSLQRGVCSCAELHIFSCHRAWKEACQMTRAISTAWRRQLSLSFFFFLFSCQPSRRRKFTLFWQKH